MVEGQTLEAIKGGGGSIKVGTTGTINALMSRELQSVKVGSPSAVPLPNEAATGTTPKARVQADEASTSSSSNSNTRNGKHAIVDQKTKHHPARQDSRNPFLRSDSVSVDGNGNGTNNRRKSEKKGSCMVEIVDVKCGVPDKMWANPITNRLKKLTFSKLSEPNGVNFLKPMALSKPEMGLICGQLTLWNEGQCGKSEVEKGGIVQLSTAVDRDRPTSRRSVEIARFGRRDATEIKPMQSGCKDEANEL
ncbi:hypothetical protein L1987_19639 [Smallanthus sonchifolius]|uniref:Uncharacterized protein n=1 Tax=Smallanthus sonchifolius TaxID=185202 RepID=A0ACB9IRA4_9ASTR|nr:hypothetical protein L1987_19639 [Smallanthus sonchifolius]